MRTIFAVIAAGIILSSCAFVEDKTGVDLNMMDRLGSDDPIKSAEKAAPKSLSGSAEIRDWDGNVLREGTNGWICLPDNAGSEGTDPWCFNEAWEGTLTAYMAKEDPDYDTVGIAYMLAGDTPVSNTDPYATEFTSKGDWVVGLGAHLMVLVPGKDSLEGFSTDPYNGGPWVMWPGTPYEHLMIPIDGIKRP